LNVPEGKSLSGSAESLPHEVVGDYGDNFSHARLQTRGNQGLNGKKISGEC
jgi:hypothetical protein